jgi:hypothetical protein
MLGPGCRYLANLDGISASSRLAVLLGMNSAVLKQASSQQEWYYRSLRPCVQYLPFWQAGTTDILDLVSALQGEPGNEAVARAVAANGQAFAMVRWVGGWVGRWSNDWLWACS